MHHVLKMVVVISCGKETNERIYRREFLKTIRRSPQDDFSQRLITASKFTVVDCLMQ